MRVAGLATAMVRSTVEAARVRVPLAGSAAPDGWPHDAPWAPLRAPHLARSNHRAGGTPPDAENIDGLLAAACLAISNSASRLAAGRCVRRSTVPTHGDVPAPVSARRPAHKRSVAAILRAHHTPYV